MQKIWTIAWATIYKTFTDRNLLIVMILTPLMISSIVALAFGGIGGDGTVSIARIPIAVVNMDSGTEQNGEPLNYGAIMTGILAPDESSADSNSIGDCPIEAANETNNQGSLSDLLATTVLTDEAEARAGVQSGDYTAVVIIPEDFSQQLSYSRENGLGNTAIEVYANNGRIVMANIVRSVVEGISNQFASGNIVIAATLDTLIDRAETNPVLGVSLGVQSGSGAFQPDFSCAFSSVYHVVKIDANELAITEDEGLGVTSIILVLFGSSQAVFFALFTGQGTVLDIFNERKQGTLQRLLVTPTPRWMILAGKLLGAFITVIFQLVLLMIAMVLVASIFEGRLVMIWGSNIIGIIAVILALAIAVSALAVLLAGLTKTMEQAQLVGNLVNIVLGMLGGAFFQAESFLDTFGQISLIYWGREAFLKLAEGNADIGINLLVLLAQGVVMFAIGVWFFNRRVEVYGE